MKHTVSACIAALEKERLIERIDLGALGAESEIFGLSYDNRTVQVDDLFVCKGAAFQPQYLDAAMRGGALLYVADRVWNAFYPHIIVADIREAMSVIAKWFYEEKVKALSLVGITGTKGKTTVSTFIRSILSKFSDSVEDRPVAIMGSEMIFDGKQEHSATLSTPETLDLWRYLATARDAHARYAVCEVSSQGLKYRRTKGLQFDVAVFLNIGEDHISDVEHRDFEDYFSSKLKIFEGANYACINSCMDHFERVYLTAQAAGCEIVTFGYRNEDTLQCLSAQSQAGGSVFTVSWKNGKEETYTIAMAGRYNIENALACLAIAYLLGIPYEYKRNGMQSMTVRGRGVHLATADGAITTIVDYAHNKISMEALLSYVKECYPHKKVITVFGCPGGKAQNRRKSMGDVASRFSDHVIITEDDPDKEPLEDICREIATAIEENNGSYEIILERKKAIQRAFSEAEKGGIILLCGKGAEKAQKRNGQAVPYETDEYIASQCIEAYDKKTDSILV